MIISLIGFMGCGKSSVGRELSRLLCCRFMDLDDVIVESEGRSIPEIFATDGEAAFRRMELNTLSLIIQSSQKGDLKQSLPDVERVLALGGGTVMTPECADLITEHTFCIYLKASVDTLVEHLSGEADGRPMLNSSDDSVDKLAALRHRITELMALRSDTYQKTAHIIIDTDGKSISTISKEIINSL